MREEENVTKGTLSSSTLSSPVLSWHLLDFVSQRARAVWGEGCRNDLFEFFFFFLLGVRTFTGQVMLGALR